jgi:microcystin-dependent protein
MSSKAYVYDRSSNSWITGEQAGVITPSGLISPFAGVNQPAGWLFCFGQTLNAVTSPQFQSLYNSIGNAYGGTNNSNFVVPDLRGRTSAGKDNMGGTAASRLTNINGQVLGAAGGDQNMAHNHSAYGAGGDLRAAIGATGSDPASLGYIPIGVNGPGSVGDYTVNPGGGWTNAVRGFNHYTPVYGYVSGASNANNIQPTIVLNYIIKI